MMWISFMKVINQYELLLWLFKFVNNKVCHDFQLIRVAETHRYPTRSDDNFVVSNFIKFNKHCGESGINITL
jgi:hypothetical protein